MVSSEWFHAAILALTLAGSVNGWLAAPGSTGGRPARNPVRTALCQPVKFPQPSLPSRATLQLFALGTAATGGDRGRKMRKARAGEVEGKRLRRKQRKQPPLLRHRKQPEHEKKQNFRDGVISSKHALDFEREGHTMLRSLVSGAELAQLTRAIQSEYEHRAAEAYTNRLRELGVSSNSLSRAGRKAALAKACRERGLPIPALQVYNIHREDRPSSKAIFDFVTSASMGRAAAELLGVDSVMLYQTAAFYKLAGEGETAWHSDLNTAPFDTNHMVTFWIALSDVPSLEHSPLVFASRSHRDFALPYWHTTDGMRDLDARGYKLGDHAPLVAGDATAHHGWVVHAAPPNESGRLRKALGVAYIEAHARRLGVKGTRQEPNDVDRKGYKAVVNDALIGNTHEAWIPTIKPGQPVIHESLPVVYSRPGTKKPTKQS